MTGRSAAALLPLILILVAAPPASAEEEPTGWRLRLRMDTVLRWSPRYVVRVADTQLGADQVYWERVDQLPIYQRVNLDADWRGEDGWAADIHASAWAALDLLFDEEGGFAAGDFALAYGRGTYGPVSVWLGRRFVPWGPPGGLHIDGGGVEVRTRFGLAAEAVVGRPVTPAYDSLLGPRISFDGAATLAYGARLGYRYPGRLSASLSYVERWAEGIAADRLISTAITAVPTRRLDLRGALVFDPTDLAVEQASAQIFVLVADFLELDAGYAHADPSRLIPRWSILSAFASSVFHEGSLGGTVTIARSLLLRAEGAFRWYHVPGREGEENSWWGYRADFMLRWLPVRGRVRLLLGASRRADDEVGLTLIHGAVGTDVHRLVQLAFEVAVALDDERDGDKDAYLGRASIAIDVGSNWVVGATFDAARTPFVDFEARGMVRASWRPSWGRTTR